jgi:hypothetical protein
MRFLDVCHAKRGGNAHAAPAIRPPERITGGGSGRLASRRQNGARGTAQLCPKLPAKI